MLVQIIIILFLLVIVYNLGAGLVYMLRDHSKTPRTLRALSWRIGLSIFLFILLVIGKFTGLIEGNPDPITGQPPGVQQER